MPVYSASAYPQYSGDAIQVYQASLTATTSPTAGQVLALLNPFGVNMVILDAYINITTAAGTDTNTMDMGVAANGTTSSDTLFDGQAASAGIKAPGGTNGAAKRAWSTTQYVTGTASATLAGMVATVTLICIRA
jgi:hypothetical protein